MNLSICLDQYASNFNVNSISSNGFSIYTDLDNFTTPIAQGIPYQNLFSAPIGNCPYLLTNIPAGVTQLLVIDSCTSNPSLPGSTTPTSQELLIDCCYALIDVPQIPYSFCNTCSLDFDVFSSSYVGQIVAGNLTSNCGSVTDYTIGWYKDGDYSSPEFVSGYGNSFLPYQTLHPLTGSSAVPAAAGDWEGIIHDIAINGVTYSSVSGSANGQPIPFESCFGTIVIDPLTCNNGPISSLVSKYSHQINYDSQAIGTSPAPVSLTYNLSSSTNYFAYAFRGYNIWDEIEIKFISGNPSATSNPSLYSQPIYLEKIKVGQDATTIQEELPSQFNFNGLLNNTWPKSAPSGVHLFQRVFRFNTLDRSTNPSTPDQLEITITPNPTNNNTRWEVGFQCLDDFDCTDCVMDNWPNTLPKIWKVELDKIPGCEKQKLIMHLTSSCSPSTSDFMGSYNNLLNDPSISLIGSVSGYPATISAPHSGYINLAPIITCGASTSNVFPTLCGPSSTGNITLNKTPQQIKLTFNNYNDYLHYKDDIVQKYLETSMFLPSPVICDGTTNLNYYRYFTISIPTQGANSNCGDSSTRITYLYHFNDYFNIIYTNDNNPSATSWSITIPQSQMVNCYPSNLGQCNTCYNSINTFVNQYNIFINDPATYTFTTNVGAKYDSPIGRKKMNQQSSTPVSGSYCDYATSVSSFYPWYAVTTVPFISSSTGWINLYSLQTSIPCNITSSYPDTIDINPYNLSYQAHTAAYRVRFPSLTGSFDCTLSTNDFEIYSRLSMIVTGSLTDEGLLGPVVYPPPCPDPYTSKIYSYIGGVATVYSSSYFWNGANPTLIIDPGC